VTSAKVTETVNSTVNSVDETVTGGALDESGVTATTEEAVNGVAGPESVVGEAVDEVGNAVGGLLGGGN
jgi:phage-related minor tail protein